MQCESVSFYSEGVRLAGDLYRPADAGADEARAGILLCHGYTGVKSLYANAGEPKKLVVLEGYGHYDVYAEPPFGEVMAATLAWYREHLPVRAA